MSVFLSRKIVLPMIFDPVFSNNTWENIVAACHSNRVPSTWNVGDQKPMKIDGVDYLIDIIGINHDTYSDGTGTAPLTFQLHNLYATKYNMNDSAESRWKDSLMRNTNIPEILDKMPVEVSNGIRKVVKKTCIGDGNATIELTEDKLFLLSEFEVFGIRTHSLNDEGIQYSYYLTESAAKTLVNGTSDLYVLRSPDKTNSGFYCGVTSDGKATNRYYTSTKHYLSFAFCF